MRTLPAVSTPENRRLRGQRRFTTLAAVSPPEGVRPMKTLALILAGAALALTGPTAAPPETLAEKGEARLARMLEGRTRRRAGHLHQRAAQQPPSGLSSTSASSTTPAARSTSRAPTDPRQLGRMGRAGDRALRQPAVHQRHHPHGRPLPAAISPARCSSSDFVPYTKARLDEFGRPATALGGRASPCLVSRARPAGLVRAGSAGRCRAAPPLRARADAPGHAAGARSS